MDINPLSDTSFSHTIFSFHGLLLSLLIVSFDKREFLKFDCILVFFFTLINYAFGVRPSKLLNPLLCFTRIFLRSYELCLGL